MYNVKPINESGPLYSDWMGSPWGPGRTEDQATSEQLEWGLYASCGDFDGHENEINTNLEFHAVVTTAPTPRMVSTVRPPLTFPVVQTGAAPTPDQREGGPSTNNPSVNAPQRALGATAATPQAAPREPTHTEIPQPSDEQTAGPPQRQSSLQGRLGQTVHEPRPGDDTETSFTVNLNMDKGGSARQKRVPPELVPPVPPVALPVPLSSWIAARMPLLSCLMPFGT